MAVRSSEKDIHIIRTTPERIPLEIQQSSGGIYYYIENDKYIVYDMRKKSPKISEFDSAEEIINEIK